MIWSQFPIFYAQTMEMQNYLYALQVDTRNQDVDDFFWGAHAPALTHQTGCD